jgi:hypothetical protein
VGEPALVIQSVEPPCPLPGDLLSVAIAGPGAARCREAQVFLAGRELIAPVAAGMPPATVAARLPADLVPLEGAELRVVCGGSSSSVRLFGGCPGRGGTLDAGTDGGAAEEDAAPLCAQPIEAVIEAVDKRGAPFATDADGTYQAPIIAGDLSLDTGRSRNVSSAGVSYTFSGDCFPTVTVQAPVLGGFDTRVLGPGRRCAFAVEIVDRHCPRPRAARAQGAVVVVP